VRVLRLNKSMPTVSIILPTYNRAKFLPDAFAAIAGQQWTDWELIVVDDGSTDNTRELVPELTRGWPQPVRYIHQENQGAYGARNTGLDHAGGKYIAFYDSDDLWLPHHLQDCVEALEANPDVDWVWGACRIVNLTTGEVTAPTTFVESGRPRPFTKLRSRQLGSLRIIDDHRAACCQIEHGLYCGLQNSVIRRQLFESYRFNSKLRNEAEDQVVVIWALASGFRFAYLDNTHVTYHIHESNSSSTSPQEPVQKQRRIYEAVIAGFERLEQMSVLGPQERRALARRLGDEHFWRLGYAIFWMNGQRKEALAQFHKGLAYRPWNLRFWKTYISVHLRSWFEQDRTGISA
jgi:glycosyltransferase involved in cell wall biosynthesis